MADVVCVVGGGMDTGYDHSKLKHRNLESIAYYSWYASETCIGLMVVSDASSVESVGAHTLGREGWSSYGNNAMNPLHSLPRVLFLTCKDL